MTTALQTEIERLSLDLHEARETIAGLRKERDELIHDNAEYVGAANELATENQRLRVALEMIAGIRPCADVLMGNADIARAALAQEES